VPQWVFLLVKIKKLANIPIFCFLIFLVFVTVFCFSHTEYILEFGTYLQSITEFTRPQILFVIF
jgi:hypothetical protein